MKIKGIKRGKTIEILEEINIPDGTEVIFDIEEKELLTESEKVKKLKEIFSDWKDKQDFVKTMEELESEKNTEWEKQYGQFA